jgi:GNAT superfamily N-acetyltransferase
MTSTGDVARVTYEVVAAADFPSMLDDLGDILADAVDSGASVNFIRPFSVTDGVAWWTARVGDIAAGTIQPIVARIAGRIEGVTLLVLARNPNAPHRAEVQKVLVHRRARRHGLGTGLMNAVEDLARSEGRWLLILDTFSGSDADRLYRRLGWIEVGRIPDHSLLTDGELGSATIFRKDLRGSTDGG